MQIVSALCRGEYKQLDRQLAAASSREGYKKRHKSAFLRISVVEDAPKTVSPKWIGWKNGIARVALHSCLSDRRNAEAMVFAGCPAAFMC